MTDYFLKSANSIYHDGFRQYLLQSRFFDAVLNEGFAKINDPEEFVHFYPRWIASSKFNSFRGLESYPERYITLGITQAIDEWHGWCQRNGKRLRLFKGEYPYTRDGLEHWRESDYIEDLNLKSGDAVVVSLPFSATGDVHPQWESLVRRCEVLDTPLFVDCAFFGVCGGIEVDLASPAILGVAFSTTKGLGCGNWRSGLTFSRIRLPHLHLQNQWRHGIHLNVQTGLHLMQKFSPDFIYETYRSTQLKVCELLKLTPTPSVHLATSDSKCWSEFTRDGVVNRIGLAKAIRDYYRKGRLLIDLQLENQRS